MRSWAWNRQSGHRPAARAQQQRTADDQENRRIDVENDGKDQRAHHAHPAPPAVQALARPAVRPCPRPNLARDAAPEGRHEFHIFGRQKLQASLIRPPFFQMHVARPDRIRHESSHRARRAATQRGCAACDSRRHHDQRFEAALLHPLAGLVGIADGVARLLADIHAAAEQRLLFGVKLASSSRVVTGFTPEMSRRRPLPCASSFTASGMRASPPVSTTMASAARISSAGIAIDESWRTPEIQPAPLRPLRR